MKNNILKTIKLVFLFLIFFIFPVKVTAGFGVSPGEIYNEFLKPGSHFEQEIYLTRSDPDESLKITVEPDDSEVNNWIKFIPGKTFTFEKGKNRMSLKAIVDVPKDANLKKYHGIIRVKASAEGESGGGVSVVKGTRMEVNLVTTQINVSQLIVRNFSIEDTKVNDNGDVDIKLKLKIENAGNIALAPDKVTLDLENLQQKLIETLTNSNKIELIPPNETKDVDILFTGHVGGGEYYAVAKVYLNGKVLRAERLVIKVTGQSKTDIAPKDKGSIGQLQNIFKSLNRQVTVNLLALLFAIISLTSLVVIFIKSKEKKLIGTLFVIFSIFFTLIGYVVVKNYKAKTKPTSDTGQQVVTNSGTVKGESTTKKKYSPLLIRDGHDKGKYYIYEQPDINSPKIFVATEDEKFPVLEELSTWYRIQLPNDKEAWLPKNNIKKVE